MTWMHPAPCNPRLLLVAASACLCVLCGCVARGTDYFPLGTKQTWEYLITRKIKGETHQQKLIITNLPAVSKDDGAVYYPRRRLDDRVEWYERTANGVFLLNASGTVRSRMLPADLKTGTHWNEPTRIMFLEMTGAFSLAFKERAAATLSLDYVIEGMDDVVNVAAGHFEHCMRVHGTGSNFAGSLLETYLQIRFIKVEQTDWYAPGVGLVKRVRNEYTTPADFSNEYREELEAVR